VWQVPQCWHLIVWFTAVLVTCYALVSVGFFAAGSLLTYWLVNTIHCYSPLSCSVTLQCECQAAKTAAGAGFCALLYLSCFVLVSQ
jgi:hypothetical protein